MSPPDLWPLVSEAALNELAERGQAIYEARLQRRLEADAPGQFVAIHVDTEDHAVARTSADAWRALRRRHPVGGRLFVRRIGDEPQSGLAARILQSDMVAARPK